MTKPWEGMLPSEVCEKAREILHEDGWCKGTVQNKEGQVCLMGAFNKALTGSAINHTDTPAYICWGSSDTDPLTSKLWEKIAERTTATYTGDMGGECTTRGAGWNDKVAKDQQEVIDVIDAMAKDFRNQGE